MLLWLDFVQFPGFMYGEQTPPLMRPSYIEFEEIDLKHIYCTMSTASKITLGASCVFAVGSFVFINYSQQLERTALRQGPIKDAERMNEKFNKKQLANDLEHKEQMELREKLIKIQPLSNEIIVGEDDK